MKPTKFFGERWVQATCCGMIFASVAGIAGALTTPTHPSPTAANPANTRLLRQPSLSATEIVFVHAADLWVVGREGGLARRLTSTPAVESDPHFSPDGQWIAFTSNRSGNPDVYLVAASGGAPTRLTYFPEPSLARGWSPDGSRVLFASERASAPSAYTRLWTVPAAGGPSTLLPAPMGFDASYSPDGRFLAVDRVDRWDTEWRSYRGGQNTPITLLELESLAEQRLPNERTTDRDPVWLGDAVYFLSDRDWAMNIWSYAVKDGGKGAATALRQLTFAVEDDIQALAGHGNTLVYEQAGTLHLLDLGSGQQRDLEIQVAGDFPWAEPQWEDVAADIANAALSPSGKRALFEARGEIFTVPAKKGPPRNLTRSSGSAERAPIWSPDGKEVAYVSDASGVYEWVIAAQDGQGTPRRWSLGESKMVWEPVWSPDGKKIAFVDDDVRVRILDVASGALSTVDSGGTNIERGSMGLTWSPDSAWLAYAKTQPNQMRRIVVWSRDGQKTHLLTDGMADAAAPAWDREGRYLYFLASTEVALGSGWANTSSIRAQPKFGVYAMVLRGDDNTPLQPESDEEVEAEDTKAKDEKAAETGDKKTGDKKTGDKKASDKKGGDKKEEEADEAGDEKAEEAPKVEVKIELAGIERRILALPMPTARYFGTLAGPTGTLFVLEQGEGGPVATLHQWKLEDREAKVFLAGISRVAISGDGQKLLYQQGETYAIVDTAAPPEPGKGALELNLTMWLDRAAEYRQIFEEAWRYQRDFFYDPAMHGNDWQAVYQRYAPLVPYVRHRRDLHHLLDQVNGELSVGHSFVFGGDHPEVEKNRVGLLGADLVADQGYWRIQRILTYESWNPQLKAPLAEAGLKVAEGQYLVAVDGRPLTANDDPYRLLDGTAGVLTRLEINSQPTREGAWTIRVEPIANERQLRRRAWIEDNRRQVERLSGGRLAYVWVPDTGDRGIESFDRYYFAQQDKEGAVIDERFNGGGNLDDYMVDLMTRDLRAAITNEVPNPRHLRLPAGILGPKVLLINELAGSGGDFFPWVFRRLQIGPLIGARTWGGLVKSSVHYALVDGGALTAPDNAVFDPIAKAWIGENEGIPPDIEVLLDAKTVAAGRDPQLERAVEEALKLLAANPPQPVEPPAYSKPSRRPAAKP